MKMNKLVKALAIAVTSFGIARQMQRRKSAATSLQPLLLVALTTQLGWLWRH